MVKVVITHSVADVDKWLTFKAERAEAIGKLGGTNVQEHAAYDGSNAVAITCEMEDVDAAMATVTSPPPELGEVMGKHGVIPPLTAYVAR
jgi:hypothetical protein